MITIQAITEVPAQLAGIRAAIFDLDDTLYSEKEYVRSGYRAAAEVLPQVDHCAEKLWAAFEAKQNAFDEVLRAEGISAEEWLIPCLQAYRYHKPEIHLYPGAVDMLRQLRAQGVGLGMITDGRSEGQRAKIEALGLAPLFECIIVTDELGGVQYRKPNERAYRLMQNFFGVPFEAMAYIGDNRKKDFKAPEALGMRSIWFRNPDGIYFEGDPETAE